MSAGYIIQKNGALDGKPYDGPVCQFANVPRGKIYDLIEEAEEDAVKLNAHGNYMFVVYSRSVTPLLFDAGLCLADLRRAQSAPSGIDPQLRKVLDDSVSIITQLAAQLQQAKADAAQMQTQLDRRWEQVKLLVKIVKSFAGLDVD